MTETYTATIPSKSRLLKKFTATTDLSKVQFAEALNALERDILTWPSDLKIMGDWNRAAKLELTPKQAKALIGAITFAGMWLGNIGYREAFENTLRQYGLHVEKLFEKPVKETTKSDTVEIAEIAPVKPRRRDSGELREMLRDRRLWRPGRLVA